MDISGRPMLARVVERAKRAKLAKEVVVATTIKPKDDEIAELCNTRSWPCFRGSEADVLDRYFHAGQAFQADIVVRVTSDCPLIDPDLVDDVIQAIVGKKDELDYVCNNLPPRSFPRGLDVEAMRFSALKQAWVEDKNPQWREHVTQYIRRHPELFRLYGITNKQNYSAMRWTVDTRDDLEFTRTIYTHFGHDRFSWHEVISALQQHPEWQEINRHVEYKPEPA
jgi:spore coat polysaccharide biosynthesis protein SpsF